MPAKRYVVVGLGKFGSGVALGLRELGHEVVAVDLSREKVEKIADRVTRALIGDAADRGVLEAAGAVGAEAGVVSTGKDLTASVLTALALRDLGVSHIHVKVISDTHARIVETLGYAETVFPEREAAGLLARRVSSRSILHYADLGAEFSAEEIAVPDAWVAKTLRELELPRRYGVSVVAVRDYLTGKTHAVPNPDQPLKESDSLLVAGAAEALRGLPV